MRSFQKTTDWTSPEAFTLGRGRLGSHGKSVCAIARRINVSDAERYGSAIAGGVLLLNGLRRRTLGGALIAAFGGLMLRRAVTGHCDAYQVLGMNRASGDGAEPGEYFERGIHVVESVTVNASAEELYRYWRNFENLPQIMSHLSSVRILDDQRSRWTARAPTGLGASWEAAVINDVPNEKIAWRSLYPATISNAGSVQFIPAPKGRGTNVTVTLAYIPPAGEIGAWIARFFGNDPAAVVREDLRRFKSIFEAGKAPAIHGQSHGRRSSAGAVNDVGQNVTHA